MSKAPAPRKGICLADLEEAWEAELDQGAKRLLESGEASTLEEARRAYRDKKDRETSEHLRQRLASLENSHRPTLSHARIAASSLGMLDSTTSNAHHAPPHDEPGNGVSRFADPLFQPELPPGRLDFIGPIPNLQRRFAEERQKEREWRAGVLDTLQLLAEGQNSLISEQRAQGKKARALRRNLWLWGLIFSGATSLMLFILHEFV